jgi:hypothetical protein
MTFSNLKQDVSRSPMLLLSCAVVSLSSSSTAAARRNDATIRYRYCHRTRQRRRDVKLRDSRCAALSRSVFPLRYQIFGRSDARSTKRLLENRECSMTAERRCQTVKLSACCLLLARIHRQIIRMFTTKTIEKVSVCCSRGGMVLPAGFTCAKAGNGR